MNKYHIASPKSINIALLHPNEQILHCFTQVNECCLASPKWINIALLHPNEWIMHCSPKSKEIYIVSITNDIANTKIRDDKIDTKRLIQTKDNLEQWKPVTKTEFPVLKEYLLDQFFPSLSAVSPILYNNFYSVSAFIATVSKSWRNHTHRTDRFLCFNTPDLCVYMLINQSQL